MTVVSLIALYSRLTGWRTYGIAFIGALMVVFGFGGLIGDTSLGLTFLNGPVGLVVCVIGFIVMLYSGYRYRHKTRKLR